MIKITEDLRRLVQSKFSASGANVITLLQDRAPKSLKTKRLVVLLHKDNTDALVTLITSASKPQFSSELDTEEVLPVERDFECVIGTAEEFKEQSDVFFKITCRRTQRLYQMKPGVRCTNFISEILRAIDQYRENPNPAEEYKWVSRIAGSIPSIEHVVHEQTISKRSEYTRSKILRLFVGTYNVNGQSPERLTVEKWLCLDPISPDVYAIGFQELDLSKETFLLNETKREYEWEEILLKSLHPNGTYKLTAKERLVGLMIFVFVKTMHLPHVKNVDTAAVGAGLMKIMGNKGGVAVSLSVYGTSMCFVNTHLAAHMDEYVKRNQDFARISAEIHFDESPTEKLIDHDQVYWMGDLNYRISDLDADEVKQLIAAEDYKSLLVRDQLNEQKREGKVFVGFREAEIKFKPTYKYDPGTDDWDSSDKERAPAWCDRILWRGDSIFARAYRSHPEIKISDHKPISAIFNSEVVVVDKHKCHVIYKELVRRIKDVYFIPEATVDILETNFDNLRLEESKKSTLGT